ncbi:MAG: 5'/3'-nucleotidase SurE, partial [Acidimicrobiia bacterium]
MLLVAAGGCQLLESANRYAAAPGAVSEPFWCAPSEGTALTASDCQLLSAHLDFASSFANAHHEAADAAAAGATSSAYEPGVGAPFQFSPPTAAFNPAAPDTLLYDGTDPDAQVAGIEWNVTSASAPDGFVGPNDEWTAEGGGVWRLRAWILRPFQNEPNVFDHTHPCLDVGGPVYDISAACYTSTHPNPLQILVTNDDGYSSDGIDAAVEAVRLLPNVEVTVVAPATNQSGSGRKTSPGPLTATDEETASGYPAKSVVGFPADSVRYALDTLHENPDLLVSGINDGQNLGPVTALSGTVGAAREGALDGIPAVAASQGLATEPPLPVVVPDFPSGAVALMSWVDDFLLGRVGPNVGQTVANINIPTCSSGSIRGTLVLPSATDFSSGSPLDPSNCLSTATE